MVSNIIFGGVEGGASYSSIVLVNGNGECLAECSGLGTNIWILGMDEARERIVKLIRTAMGEANLPEGTKIRCICLSLSGAELEETNEEFRKGIMKTYPDLCEDYVICSDTAGPIAAAHDKGGVVLIAGTGSNALLINPDGSSSSCGGWGHMLGDEAGAFWIAHKALKVHFDFEDKLHPPPHGYSTDVVWETTKEFFNVETRLDMLPHLYKNFQKSFFAKLCKQLSVKAQEGDSLCRWVFKEAGIQLAKHLQAVSFAADESLMNCEGGLPVVCVGSVWKSWELMKPGFVQQISERRRGSLKEFSLLRLTTSPAMGAVYIAAKAAKFDLPRNYSDNYRVFFNSNLGEI